MNQFVVSSHVIQLQQSDSVSLLLDDFLLISSFLIICTSLVSLVSQKTV